MANWIAAELLGPVLNGVLVGTGVAGMVWVLLRALPRTSATMRYAVWLITLLAIVSLPALMVEAPAAAGQGTAAPAPAEGVRALLTLPAPGHAAFWLFGLWAAVASLMLLRLVWSYWSVLGLKRRARPAEGAAQAQFKEVFKAYGGRRPVRLCVSPETGVPIAAGLSNPVILIPESLQDRLSEAELRQVLVHELAHIRRWDDWTNLVQKIAEAVFFFNPAVLWIARRLNLEREIACDDWVVSMTGAARPYAACLTKLVELSGFSRGPQLAHPAVARKPQISLRIESLLSRKHGGSTRFSAAGVLASSGGLAVVALLAAHVAPIAIAQPDVPTLPSAEKPIPVVASAYSVPAPAPQPVRSAAPKRVIQAAAPRRAPAPMPVAAQPQQQPDTVQFMVVEQWTVVQSRDQAATLCVLYVRQAINARESLVKILWTHPKASPIPDGRT